MNHGTHASNALPPAMRSNSIARPQPVIEFDRIAGGKAFDASVPWFMDLLRELGQA